MRKLSPSSTRLIPCFCLLASALYIAPASAQTTTAAEPVMAPIAAAPASSLLSISLPPNSKLRFDLDARDKELLGVVKSLLEGFNGDGLYNILKPKFERITPTGEATTASKAPDDIKTTAMVQMLADVDLETMLEDVNHIRVVAFETPRAADRAKAMAAAAGTLKYYEDAYITREGGRRILRADFDDMQVLGVSFPKGGFGLVFSGAGYYGPGMGVVIRSDGYPNLKSVGPLTTALALLFSPNPR
ncbi:hypothetical protein EON80_15680 [bacterium]|nr:MAG: hypothetical protein EON80_15680 [bacterium]